MGDLIDSFTIRTSAVNQAFVRENLNKNLISVSLEKLICRCVFRFSILQPSVLKIYKLRRKEQYTAHIFHSQNVDLRNKTF